MADGSLRSVAPPGMAPERDIRLSMVESDGGAAPPAPVFGMAVPARIVLSETSELWGISPGGWLSALLLLGALAISGAVLDWRVAPLAPWPSDPVRFRVVFEEPAPPAIETAAISPAQLPVEPPSVAPSEPPVPPTMVAQPEALPSDVEPEPSPIAVTPSLTPLPKPPPAKPTQRHVTTVPTPAPSHVAATEPASPGATQTAALQTVAPVVRGLSLPPSLDYAPKPPYPAAARTRGLQGRVVLRIDITAAGVPGNVSVVTGSGHAILDRAAIAMVQSWRFHPAMRDGIAVDGQVEQPIDFHLED